MSLVSGQLRDFSLRESGGEQQPRHQPAGNGFDGWLLCPHLGPGPAVDNLPEALLGDVELISKDAMEQVLADLCMLIVRDLGTQTRTVGQVQNVAPMITRLSTAPGEVRLLRPAAACDIPAQFPEGRQGSGAGEGRSRRLWNRRGEQDLAPLFVRLRAHEPVDPGKPFDHVWCQPRTLVGLDDFEQLIDLVQEVVAGLCERGPASPDGEFGEPDRHRRALKENFGAKREVAKQCAEVSLRQENGGICTSARDPRRQVPQGMLMKVGEVCAGVGIAAFVHRPMVLWARTLVKLYKWGSFPPRDASELLERPLGILRGSGFPDEAAYHAISAIANYATGFTVLEIVPGLRGAAGAGVPEYRQLVTAYLQRLPPDAYPNAAAVAPRMVGKDDEDFDYGVGAMVAGIRSLMRGDEVT